MCQKDDTISRKAAIDAVHKNYDVILDFTSDGQTISSSIEDILSELPSAQPEVAKDTNVLTNDCISRQEAIDALRTHERKASKKWFDNQLDIEWNNAIDICCYDIEDLPSAQPEQRWIPCSERVPEHGGRYLISVLDGINRRTSVAPYLPRCKAWTMTGRMA